MTIKTASTIPELRTQLTEWHQKGHSIALVPTMGALHEGHLSLVKLAQKHAEKVVVSVFVNPTQFGPNEDFHRYPRPIEDDLKLLNSIKTDLAFTPIPGVMYPEGFKTTVSVKGLSNELEGAIRPGHFDGVATIVTKLLLQALPDVAIFGEKDYQQLLIVKQLVADLNIPTHIIAAPTEREQDGLAMSSRNRYLTPENRKIAPQLYSILSAVATMLRQGIGVEASLKKGIESITAAGFQKLDYLELRDAQTLEPLTGLSRPARLLVAARLGTTRLIDNIEVNPTH